MPPVLSAPTPQQSVPLAAPAPSPGQVNTESRSPAAPLCPRPEPGRGDRQRLLPLRATGVNRAEGRDPQSFEHRLYLPGDPRQV